jgi:hypothetical protein
MQVDLLTTAIVCGLLGFGCWIMAARNKRPEAAERKGGSSPGIYLRSNLFTTRGNLWRWGYLVFNAIAVLCFGTMFVLSYL